ncbi:hypothetical protein ACSLBF_12615 [Pseudoalteromonas sp. T1lg65]|uniref:hypothetical protein n=1 Tax=Pseudoalteromonas sp. T1lg65 TaxID=2077101 RepID=UPI003F79B252
MKHHDEFENQLKQAYLSQKQPRQLSTLQRIQIRIAHFRQTSTLKNKLQYVQWSAVACSLALLCGVWFKNSPTANTMAEFASVHDIDYQNYGRIETHEITQGKYHAQIRAKKTQLEDSLKQSQEVINQVRYGQLVKATATEWLIAECNTETLLEIKSSLLAELQVMENKPISGPQQNNVLALIADTSGHIIAIEGLTGGQLPQHACP